MVVILHGPIGPGVARHVEKEVNSVLAGATIPRRRMVEQTAGDWVKIWKNEVAGNVGVRVSSRKQRNDNCDVL